MGQRVEGGEGWDVIGAADGKTGVRKQKRLWYRISELGSSL